VASVFFLSKAFDSLSFFYFGIFSWLLESWGGILILPQIKLCGKTSPKYCPLLDRCPLNIVLGMYKMGDKTYAEHKVIFEEEYPNRTAIDDLSNEEVGELGRESLAADEEDTATERLEAQEEVQEGAQEEAQEEAQPQEEGHAHVAVDMATGIQ